MRLGSNARKIGQGTSGGRCGDYDCCAAVSDATPLSTATDLSHAWSFPMFDPPQEIATIIEGIRSRRTVITRFLVTTAGKISAAMMKRYQGGVAGGA